MKRYHDYKKQLRSWSSLLLVIFLFVVSFVPPVFLHAETAKEVQDRISQKNADIAKLQAEIEAYQRELANLGSQKNSLNTSIKELDITRKKLLTDISVTQKKIDKTNLQIQDLSSDIKTKEEAIQDHKDSIALELRQANELETENMVQTFLSHQNFSSVWNDIDTYEAVREKLVENIALLKQTKGELELTRSSSLNAKNELVSLKTGLSDQQKVVAQNSNEKGKLLTQTKNSESAYQKLVAEQTAKKLAFEKELRDLESTLKFILDPSKLPGGGVLGWPLEKVFVTQQFGAKTGPHRTYASGHSGTDFRARTPLPVYAMADGIIKGTGDTDIICAGVSFGKWVLVEYNNGLSSTFGHLSLVKGSEGQRVKRGEVIGYTGGTGRVTGPHLHVSLYAASGVNVDTVPSISCPGKILKQPIAAINAYLDPMYYLPPYIPQP